MNQEGRLISMIAMGHTDFIFGKISLPKSPDYSYRKIGRRAWTGPDSTSVSECSMSKGKGTERSGITKGQVTNRARHRGTTGKEARDRGDVSSYLYAL